MVIFHHGDAVEDKGEEVRGGATPLRNKPWKKELHHQESALDKKLREEA